MALGGELEEDEYVVGGDDDEDPEPSKGKFELTEEDEDSENLIPLMRKTEHGTQLLRKLTRQVLDDFESSWESTERYRQRHAENQKLFIGDLPLKSRPFENAANVHVPMYLENMTRIVFRVAGELLKDMTNVFAVQPVGPDDVEKARLLTKHGNWQCRVQLTDFYRQMMRGILQFFSTGDVITHSWWDAERQRNVHEVLTCDDIAIPYVHLTVEPNLSDVPFKVKILNMYRHQLQARRKAGWVDVNKVLSRESSDLDDDPASIYRDTMAKSAGVEKPTEQRATPYKVLWYEGWTDVFSGPDERDRFVQVIVDYHSHIPMSVTIHEIVNWQDRLRFEREVGELEMFQQAKQAHEGAVMESQARMADIDRQAQEAAMMGQPPSPAEIEQQRLMFAPPPEPVPPAWVLEQEAELPEGEEPDYKTMQPRKPRKEPINTFAHGVCIEPMLGSLGIGYGNIQADLNKGANVLLSQTIDQASLGNSRPMVVAGNLEFERPFKAGPTAVNKAKGVSPAQLKESIMQLELGPANPQLIDLIGMVQGWGQSSASAQEVLSGAPGKSGETAKGLGLRIEQANTQLSVPTRTFAETVYTPVLKNNALLNSMFLPDEEVISVINEYRGPENITVGRQLYERDYSVVFSGDLLFKSRADRVAEADEVTQMVGGFPQMQGNNAFLHRALQKSLKARGMEDMIPLLGPEPPPPTEPFGLPPPPPPGAVGPDGQPLAPGGAPPPEQQGPPPQ